MEKPTNPPASLGQQLAELRKTAGLTQRQLAAAFGYPDTRESSRRISQWETGAEGITPPVATLWRLICRNAKTPDSTPPKPGRKPKAATN